jgi:hypothetical protein
MREMEIQEYARQFLEMHGDRAVVQAAQKARAFEERGNEEEAATCRHVQAVLQMMRGPHQS